MERTEEKEIERKWKEYRKNANIYCCGIAMVGVSLIAMVGLVMSPLFGIGDSYSLSCIEILIALSTMLIGTIILHFHQPVMPI